MVLESVTQQNIKILHIVDMGAGILIKVGRGHDCQVRVTDISVSRLHGFFRKSSQGFFLLEDNASKFGTLIQVRKPFMLVLDQPNFFQLGRSIMELTVKIPLKVCRTLYNFWCPCIA